MINLNCEKCLICGFCLKEWKAENMEQYTEYFDRVTSVSCSVVFKLTRMGEFEHFLKKWVVLIRNVPRPAKSQAYETCFVKL